MTFSEEIELGTLIEDSVMLINTATGGAVEADVSCDGPCKTVTLNPWTKLAKKTKYKVIITTDIRDLIGHAMEENKTWTFTTGRR